MARFSAHSNIFFIVVHVNNLCFGDMGKRSVFVYNCNFPDMAFRGKLLPLGNGLLNTI